ncbi:quinone oxidoreductase family protein [Natronoarchaeum rubrum]|uniref:quinone oxidoreductase family protein n=1 Tax=Natronoarchaeum rubrum TaxID=755311 RepID=UPI00211359C6|nr:NADPH:quinone oxidoreductase family protein [Natronoarchaeum rubrum]
MNVIEVTEYGDADALESVERDLPEPGPEQVRIEIESAGINFADIMQRRGKYLGGPEPRYVPGMEAAGRIDATGERVNLDEGDRVVAMVDTGAYGEYVLANPQSLFPIPEEMSFDEAAGFPVQFLTAHGCLFGWGGLEEGERVLIQAASGGVGTAAVQLASAAGAEVFGTASSQEKLDRAAELGCDHPINYVEDDFVEEIDELTDGEGVDLVLDGVGGDVFHDSLDALATFGRIVTYGAASGETASADTGRLLFENKTVIGYHLGRAMQNDPGRVLEAVPELTQKLTGGDLEVIVGESFPLEDAAEAHQYIEDRKSSGKVVLHP